MLKAIETENASLFVSFVDSELISKGIIGIELDNNGVSTRLKHYDHDVTDINERRNRKAETGICRLRAVIISLSALPLHYFLQFFFLFISGAHLPWGERILGHVDRGVADGVVSYVALSQHGTHLGVNLPRLSAAMQEVPADAPSPRRTSCVQSGGAYAFTEVLTPTRTHARARASALVLDA